MTKQYRYFSADSHFECPPDMWTHRVPKAHRERAPRRVKLPNGNDIIVEEENPSPSEEPTSLPGNPLKHFPVGLDFDNAVGAGTPQQRLKEQDADGIDAELLFASEARNSTIQDKAAFLRSCRDLTITLSKNTAASRRTGWWALLSYPILAWMKTSLK